MASSLPVPDCSIVKPGKRGVCIYIYTYIYIYIYIYIYVYSITFVCIPVQPQPVKKARGNHNSPGLRALPTISRHVFYYIHIYVYISYIYSIAYNFCIPVWPQPVEKTRSNHNNCRACLLFPRQFDTHYILYIYTYYTYLVLRMVSIYLSSLSRWNGSGSGLLALPTISRHVFYYTHIYVYISYIYSIAYHFCILIQPQPVEKARSNHNNRRACLLFPRYFDTHYILYIYTQYTYLVLRMVSIYLSSLSRWNGSGSGVLALPTISRHIFYYIHIYLYISYIYGIAYYFFIPIQPQPMGRLEVTITPRACWLSPRDLDTYSSIYIYTYYTYLVLHIISVYLSSRSRWNGSGSGLFMPHGI